MRYLLIKSAVQHVVGRTITFRSSVPAVTVPSPAELAQVQMKQEAKENMKAAYTMVARINSFAPPPQVSMPLANHPNLTSPALRSNLDEHAQMLLMLALHYL